MRGKGSRARRRPTVPPVGCCSRRRNPVWFRTQPMYMEFPKESKISTSQKGGRGADGCDRCDLMASSLVLTRVVLMAVGKHHQRI